MALGLVTISRGGLYTKQFRHVFSHKCEEVKYHFQTAQLKQMSNSSTPASFFQIVPGPPRLFPFWLIAGELLRWGVISLSGALALFRSVRPECAYDYAQLS